MMAEPRDGPSDEHDAGSGLPPRPDTAMLSATATRAAILAAAMTVPALVQALRTQRMAPAGSIPTRTARQASAVSVRPVPGAPGRNRTCDTRGPGWRDDLAHAVAERGADDLHNDHPDRREGSGCD
jgi:hypothetical protein